MTTSGKKMPSVEHASANGGEGSSGGGRADKGSAEGPTGWARVGAMRKIVNAFVKRSRLEISSLHISHPDASGMCAKGKIRLTHLGTGPVPLVGLRVKFKDPQGATLHWTPYGRSPHNANDTPSVVRVFIEPLTMQPSTPGSVSSEVDMRFVMLDGTRAAFVEFVKHMIRSDPHHGTRILMKAVGVEVKAFGLRFGGLALEKDVVLGGLGCLDGALVFDDGPVEGEGAAVHGTAAAHTVNSRAQSEQTEPSSFLDAPASTIKKKKNRLSLLRKSSKISLSSRKKQTPPSTDLPTNETKQTLATAVHLPPPAKRLNIGEMDIVGGSPERGLQVSASVVIENPARSPELIIEPGELRFALCVAEPKMVAAKTTAASAQASSLPPGYVRMGVMMLEPMVLRPGPTKVQAKGFLLLPPPPQEGDEESVGVAHRAGQQLIARILQNEKVDMCAIATRHDDAIPLSGVSNVGWLAEAFEGTRIDARIPPLGERVRLLDGAELRVEDAEHDSGRMDDMAMPTSPSSEPSLQGSVARATLRNGFAADIHVHKLTVRACSAPLIGDEGQTETLELGTVFSPSGTEWDGLTLRRDHPTHVSLPMEINPDPRVLIEILRKSARSRNVNLGNPLTELLEDLRMAHWNEAGFAEPPKSRPGSSRGTSRRNSLDPSSAAASRRSSVQLKRGEREPADDLAALLANALANLRVTAHIEAEASLGGYRVPGSLLFEQRNLPIALSTATAAALLPLVGKPFVKAMVDRAEVDVQGIDVLRMDDRGIQARVSLRVLNFGPLGAEVVFDNGLHLRHGDEEAEGPLKTAAVIHFDGPMAISAGSDEPVHMDVRIVPPPGANSSTTFSDFVGHLLRADQITYSALADPLSITSGGVHFHAALEKPITISGLGGFGGLRMNDLQILGETSAPAAGVSFSVAAPANASQPSAISFQTIAQVRNQGDIHLRIAKLEVAIAVEGVQVGQASIDDVDLKPRAMANLRAKGILYAPPSRHEAHDRTVAKISGLIESLIAGKETLVEVLGRRAWVPDTHGSRPVSLAWLDAALRTFETRATIQWKGGVQIVNKVDVGRVEATFAARKSLQLKIDDVTASYSVPFPIQFELQSIDASMDIVYGKRSIGHCHAQQETFEQLETPAAKSAQTRPDRSSSSFKAAKHVPQARRSSNATTASGSGSLANGRLDHSPSSSSLAPSSHTDATTTTPPTSGRVKLSLKEFDLETDQEDVLGDMIEHVFHAGPEGTDKITLRGFAHVKVKTVLGMLQLSVPLGVNHSLDLSGLDGLKSSPLRYTDFDIVSANPKYIQITMNIDSHNPSEGMTIHVPDSSLSLSVFYEGAFVGDVIIGGDGKGVHLAPGAVHLQGVEFRYRPSSSSEKAVRPVISRLFSGKPVELSIRGHRSSSINAALVQALRLVDVPIEIAPLGANDLLSLIRVQLGLGVVTSNSIDATYLLDNPINLPLDVLNLEVDAYYNDQPFGKASKSYSTDGKLVGRVLGSTPQPHDSPDAGDTPSQPSNNASVEESRRASTSSANPKLQRLLLPPSARKFEGALVVKLAQPPDQLVKAFLAERGNIVLDVELRARLEIQGYVIPNFIYRQKVPLEVQGLQGVARLLRLV